MARRLSAVCCTLFAFFAFASIASSESDLKSSARKVYDSVRMIRATVEKHGSQQAQQTDKKVNFIVDETSLVPYAASSGGGAGVGPKIRFSAQFRLLLVYLAEMMTLAQAGDQDARLCDQRYGTYLFERMAQNSRRAAQGGQSLDIDAPEVFATRVGGICAGVTGKFPIPASQEIDTQVHLALAFTYLHELGHLALHHQPIGDEIFEGINSQAGKMRAFLAANARSQRQEFEADAWAAKEMIDEGATAEQVVSITLHRELLASSGLDCQLSKANSHPMAVERLVGIIKTVNASGIKIRKDVADTYAEYVEFGKKVQSTLQCN